MGSNAWRDIIYAEQPPLHGSRIIWTVPGAETSNRAPFVDLHCRSGPAMYILHNAGE